MKKRSLLLALASMLALAGCGENAKKEVVPEVKKVVVDRNEYSMKVESSKKINYDVRGVGDFSKAVTITSSDEAVATVVPFESEQAFTINALKVGASTITVKSVADESKAATLALTVTDKDPVFETVEVTSVSTSDRGLSLEVDGADGEFSILVAGKGDFDETVSISNSNPSVAIADKTDAKSGDKVKVTPISEGRTSFTITSNGDKDKSCTVDVLVLANESGEEVDFVRFSTFAESCYLDEQKTIAVTSHGDVSWSLEGENAENIVEYVETSNTSATVKGIGLGQVTLVASVGEKVDKLPFKVELNPNPTFTGFSIAINGAASVPMTKGGEPGEGDLWSEQYTYDFVSVEADTRIDFFGTINGREQTLGNVSPSKDDLTNKIQNNLKAKIVGEANNWVVQKSATDAKLYLEKYEDGYRFWLTEGPELMTGYYIVVNGEAKFSLTLGEEFDGFTQYVAMGAQLNAGEHLELLNADESAKWCPKLSDAVEAAWFEMGDGYINVKESGAYDIYVKLKFGLDEIYIGKENVYTVKIGENEPVKMELNEEGKPEDAEHQYAVSAALTKGDALVFYKNGTEITQIGPDAAEGNNAIGNYEDGIIIHNDYTPEIGHNSIYLKTYTDGGYSIWAAGYEETPAVYTMTVGDSAPVTLELYNDGKPEEAVNQYAASVSLVKDEQVVFYKDGVKISKIGADTGCDNNITGYEPDGMFIHNSFTPEGTNKSVFLKEYEDGGYSVYGAGYHEVKLEKYMIKIGSADPVAMSGSDDSYSYVIGEQAKGTVIGFYGYYDDGTTSLLAANPSMDDPAHNLQNNLKKVGDSNDYALLRATDIEGKAYLDIHEGNVITFWVNEGPTIARIVGLDGDWNQGIDLVFTPAAGTVPDQYVATNVALATTDEFKLITVNGDWVGISAVEEGCKDLVQGDDNMSVKEAGNYNFYYKPGTNSLWISKAGSPIPEKEVTAIGIKIEDGDLIPLVKTETEPGKDDAWDIQYTKVLDSVKAGDSVDFYVTYDEGEPELFTSIVASPDGTDLANNLKEATKDAKDWTVQQDADSATLYVEHIADVGWKFWLTGGVEVKSGFYLEIAGGDDVKLTQVEDFGEHKQYTATVELKQNDVVSIVNYVDGAKNTVNFKTFEDDGAHDNFTPAINNSSFTCNVEGTYAFYAKMKYEDDILYIGYASPVASDYYVKIGDNKTQLSPNGDTGEYYVDDIELNITDVLEFYCGDDLLEIEPKENIKGSGSANNCCINPGTEDLGIIRHLEATEGQGIFLDPVAKTVWVSGNHESFSVLIPDTSENDLTIKGTGEGYVEYTYNFAEIDDGTQIVFCANGLIVEASPEDNEDNNATASTYGGHACCTVTEGGENLSVYLKVYENKYEVWVGKAKGDEPDTKTYSATVSIDQNWAFATDIPVFVHYWGGGLDEFVQITFVASTSTLTVEFEIPAVATGFQLVRCAAGTVTPDWAVKGDNPGRIYNKTNDCNIVDGTTNYPITFSDHNPS